MIVLRTGSGDAEASAVAMLERWHGGPITVIGGNDLKGADYLLALPGGNEDLIARARRAGVRIVEVVG